jgi:hypothetical protein
MGKKERVRGVKPFCDKGASGSKPVWEEELVFFLLDGDHYGYPQTDGGSLSNLLAMVKQEHQFISMFYAHPKHPFTKKERMVVNFCSFALAFLLTAAVEVAVTYNAQLCKGKVDLRPELDIFASEKDEHFVSQYTAFAAANEDEKEMTTWWKENEGLYDDSNIVDWNPCEYNPLGYVIMSGIGVAIWDLILKKLATCACAQNKGWCMETFAECLGYIGLCNCVVWAIGFWCAGAVILSGSEEGADGFFAAWMITKAQSWLYWFLYMIPLFYATFGKSKTKFEKDYGTDLKCLPQDGIEAKKMDEGRFDIGDYGESGKAAAAAPQQPAMIQMGGVQVHPEALQQPAMMAMATPMVQQPMQQMQAPAYGQGQMMMPGQVMMQPGQMMQGGMMMMQPGQMMQGGMQMMQQPGMMLMQPGMQQQPMMQPGMMQQPMMQPGMMQQPGM